MLICTIACPSNVPNCVKFNKLHNLMSILYSPAISQRLTIPLRRRFVSLLWKRLTLRKLFTPWQTKPAIATYHFGSFSFRTTRHKNHSCRHIRNASSHARWSNWEPNQIPWRWRFQSVLNLAMRCPVPCNCINHSIHRLAHNTRIGNDIHRRWCFRSWYASALEGCRYRTSDDNFISPKCKKFRDWQRWYRYWNHEITNGEELLINSCNLISTPHPKILRAHEAMLSQLEITAKVDGYHMQTDENKVHGHYNRVRACKQAAPKGSLLSKSGLVQQS